MSNIRICHRNYVKEDLINLFSYSSQNSQTPASNVFLEKRRSQVWRTRGYFQVTSSNNVIIFEETAATPLTASISVGEYVSDSAFLTAIKAALDAAGASTYTVARDSTSQKISITSDGGGGGGLLNLLWTDVLSTAASILGFDTAADDTGSLNYLADDAKIHTEEFLKFDFGTVSNPKAFVMTGLRGNPIGISNSAVIKLQGNSSDSWTSPAVDLTITWNEYTISHFNSSGIGGYRFWRIWIQDPENANGYLEISKVFLGDVIEPVQGSIQFPFNTRFIDLAEVTESVMGVDFTSERQLVKEIDFDWLGLTAAENEDLADFIEDVGRHEPFFVSVDPNQAFSTNSSKWVMLVKLLDDPEMSLDAPRVWAGNWALREVV